MAKKSALDTLTQNNNLTCHLYTVSIKMHFILSSYDALGKIVYRALKSLEFLSAIASSNFYAFFVLFRTSLVHHNSVVHAKALTKF